MSTILNTLSEHKSWVQVFFHEITTCVFWKRFRTKLLWAIWTLINDAIIISSKWNLRYDHRNDWKTLVDILNALGNRVTINHILVDRYHIANIKNESLMIVWLIRQIAVRRLKDWENRMRLVYHESRQALSDDHLVTATAVDSAAIGTSEAAGPLAELGGLSWFHKPRV